MVTARALSSFPILLEYGIPLLKVNGHLIAMRGLNDSNDGINALKTLDSKILAGALKIILEGGTYMPIKAIGIPGEGLRAEDSIPEGLTKRQNEVLHLLAQGKSNKQIAYEIGVSEATVKLHINALLRVLGATNRTQAVITAQKIGFLK